MVSVLLVISDRLLPLACIVLVGLATLAVIMYFRPGTVFVIRVREGKVQVVRGKVSRSFVADCERLAGEGRLCEGVIRGVIRGDGVSLSFSRTISPGIRQQLLNIWQLH